MGGFNFQPSKDSFDAQATTDLTQALRDLAQILSRGNQMFPGMIAPIPQPIQGTIAPIPPAMPGSAAAMAQAGSGQFNQFVGPLQGIMGSNPNQYASPIGPQQQWSMPYRAHDLSSGPEGILGQFGQDTLGFIPRALAGSANYAAAKTPYGTTGTTAELGLNMEMGMLKQLSQVAGSIPGLGAYAQKQFEGLEEAVYGPEQRARGRLSPTFERMAMAGINVTDKEIDEAFRFAIPMERRGVYMKQRMDRIGAAVNAENALSSALSQIGM